MPQLIHNTIFGIVIICSVIIISEIILYIADKLLSNKSKEEEQ